MFSPGSIKGSAGVGSICDGGTYQSLVRVAQSFPVPGGIVQGKCAVVLRVDSPTFALRTSFAELPEPHIEPGSFETELPHVKWVGQGSFPIVAVLFPVLVRSLGVGEFAKVVSPHYVIGDDLSWFLVVECNLVSVDGLDLVGILQCRDHSLIRTEITPDLCLGSIFGVEQQDCYGLEIRISPGPPFHRSKCHWERLRRFAERVLVPHGEFGSGRLRRKELEDRLWRRRLEKTTDMIIGKEKWRDHSGVLY